MMAFRTIKAGITSILDQAVSSGGTYEGLFTVIDFQKELQSAEEVNGNNRSVQIYYDSGDFGGSIKRDTNHKMTFKLDLTVGTSGKIDLASLDAATTDAERAAIISNAKEALDEADFNLDELIEYVYQVIMAGDNYNLGVDEGATDITVASRMITQVQKNEPIPKGEYAVVSAVVTMTCESSEAIQTTDETPGEVVDTEFEIKNDDTGVAGVINDIT